MLICFGSYALLNGSQFNESADFSFNQMKYQRDFFTRLVPICSQGLSQSEIKSSHLNQVIDQACSDFSPSLSNHGLCLTRNGENMDEVFTANPQLSVFKRIFLPKNIRQDVKKIANDPTKHHFTFVIDGNSYKDLKSGMEWNNTRKTKFSISIHEPHDIPEVRGWNNEIMVAPTGKITTIKIIQSQLKTADSAREVEVTKRKCRFHDEHDDLHSVKWHSKVNCLFDCNVKFAEKRCGCRPWDYPITSQESKASAENPTRICEFFGSSCFNMALEDNVASQCNKKCVPGCEEINYGFFITEKTIDAEKRICKFHSNPETILERQIKSHILAQFNETMGFVSSTPPESRTMNLLRDVLSNSTVSYFVDAEQAFERDCEQKIKSDIAVVVISMSSPKFNRMIRTPKATFFEKVSAFGKIIISIRILE